MFRYQIEFPLNSIDFQGKQIMVHSLLYNFLYLTEPPDVGIAVLDTNPLENSGERKETKPCAGGAEGDREPRRPARAPWRYRNDGVTSERPLERYAVPWGLLPLGQGSIL